MQITFSFPLLLEQKWSKIQELKNASTHSGKRRDLDLKVVHEYANVNAFQSESALFPFTTHAGPPFSSRPAHFEIRIRDFNIESIVKIN